MKTDQSNLGVEKQPYRFEEVLPLADVIEFKDGFRILVDMPGVREQDISLDYERNLLTVSGRASLRRQDLAPLYSELEPEVLFKRAFRVTDGVEANSAKAILKDGVLSIELHKSEKLKPRKIAVKTE